MKIAMLYGPKDKSSVVPETIVGMFAWENDKWNLYTSKKLKTQIEEALSKPILDYECKNTKSGILMMDKGTFTSADLEWIGLINNELFYAEIPNGVGKVEKVGKAEFERLKAVFKTFERLK